MDRVLRFSPSSSSGPASETTSTDQAQAATINPVPELQPAENPDEFDLRRFFELSLDLCCIAGTDSFFRMVNPAFQRILGHTAEELLKVSFIELIHPDHREPTLAEIAKERARNNFPKTS